MPKVGGVLLGKGIKTTVSTNGRFGRERVFDRGMDGSKSAGSPSLTKRKEGMVEKAWNYTYDEFMRITVI